MQHPTPTSAARTTRFSRDITPLQLPALFPAFVLFFFGMLGLVFATLAPNDETQHFIVIAPLGSTPSTVLNIVQKSQGQLVQSSNFSNTLIASSQNSDFVDTALQSGAWLILAAPRTLGCYPIKLESSNT